MSIASVGSLGSNSEKTASDYEITLSPSRNVARGALVVVWAASKGDFNNGDSAWREDPWAEIEDDAGNVWTQLIGGADTVTPGGVVSHACYAMFVCLLTEPLTTSSVITVRARNLTASGDFNAKAISAWEFSIANGKVWASLDRLKGAREDPFVAPHDPRGAAISIGAGATPLPSSTEFLILHCFANSRPASDSYTWDSDYTQIDPDGTTGGTTESNITLRGGFRIATLTSDTVDVSDDTADSALILQGICALAEVEFDDDFPTFPFLDRFTYPDQDPLPDPPWDAHSGQRPGQGSAQIRVVSHEAARSSSGSFHGSMYLDDVVPAGDDGEVFATMSVKGEAGLRCFATGSGADATLTSYGANWISPWYSGHSIDQLQWGRTGNQGGNTQNVIRAFLDRANGYKWGLQMRESGALVHLWVDDGGGWRWIGCNWITDALNGGGFGLNFMNDAVTRIDDFGGGTSIRFVPQIIRRPPDPDGAREPPP